MCLLREDGYRPDRLISSNEPTQRCGGRGVFGSPGRSTPSTDQPASTAASSSSGWSDRKRIWSGATPIALAIVSYEKLSRLAPALARSNQPLISDARSPPRAYANQSCWLRTEPEE